MSEVEKKVLTYKEFLFSRSICEPTNPWLYVREGLLTCWAESGFYKFWRKWNPPIGYLTYRLYIFLGGGKRRIPATLITFAVCGFLHDVFGVFIINRLSLKATVIFVVFGLLSLISQISIVRSFQERWPNIVNIVINLALVWASFRLGTEITESFLSDSRLMVCALDRVSRYRIMANNAFVLSPGY